MPWEAPPIKAPGSWVWWSYKIILEITHSAKLRPKDVLRTSLKDVLWTSPYGPLCIAKGFRLPTSWGRISVTLLMCSWSALFVAYCNNVIASWETGKERLSYRKRYIEEFVWGIPLFLTTCSPFYVFLLLSSSTRSSFPSDVLAKQPLWRYIGMLWGVFCRMISWVNGRKYKNLLQLILADWHL